MCLLFASVCLPCLTLAAQLSFQVQDQQGDALPDAVIELRSEKLLPHTTVHGEITQQNLTFVPWVSAVQKGTLVEFPNRDKTRHHVYSFSAPKVFELKLYANTPENPVLFDQPGIVVLGCNIHDHMQAYVYVGESPFLSVSDEAGNITFDNLPEGQYQVMLWHPWQNKESQPQTITVDSDVRTAHFVIDISKQSKPAPPRRGFGKNYR